MNILKLTDGVPSKYSESRLKRDNPNVSFPHPLNDRVLADFDCYTYTIDSKPDYNPTIQHLNQVFEQRADGWVQGWTVVDIDEDSAKNRLKNQITSDRWDKEQGGVEWLDSNFDLWRIATDNNSQQKMTSVLTMLNADPSSTGYANWKMEKKVEVTYPDVDEDDNEIEVTVEEWQKQFRQNSLEEWNEMVALVSTHIKNCFDAESNALDKVNSGDLTVTFQTEFELL
tara:strand:+ start:336 stop:1016 length:681 start_codon:yes stop_codon:yes gene_type:complete